MLFSFINQVQSLVTGERERETKAFGSQFQYHAEDNCWEPILWEGSGGPRSQAVSDYHEGGDRASRESKFK